MENPASSDMSDQVFFSLSDANGRVHTTVPLAPDGGTVRIAVGEVGRRSEVWRIWTSPGKNDLYVAARSVAGAQKFSLHQSGRWRFAYTQQWAEGRLPPDQDRAIDRWDAPAPDEEGWISALAIEVRDRDVATFPDSTRAKDVIWLDPPPEGHYVSIRLSFLAPDLGAPREVDGRLVQVIGMPNKSAVLIASTVRPIDPERWERVDMLRRDAIKRIEPPRDPGLRCAVFAYNESTRIRFVYDTAVLPEDFR